VTGHVFHEQRDELHGITVVIHGVSGRTYVGRWHERGSRGVIMRDVAIHDPDANALPLEEWLGKQRKFGIAVQEKHMIVPNEEAAEVSLLSV